MKKGLIIGLAVLLVFGLAAGMASATVVQSNTVNTTGIVTVSQFTDAQNVVFWNDLTVTGGAGPYGYGYSAELIFDQKIYTDYGRFKNNVHLVSDWRWWSDGDLKIKNFAAEGYVQPYTIVVPGPANDISVAGHRQVSFDQDVLMDDSQNAYVPGVSNQVFTGIAGAGKYIEQEVKVRARWDYLGPDTEPDSMELWDFGAGDDWFFGQGQSGVMNNKFLPPQAGGRAQLAQVGEFQGDLCAAKQKSNIGGAGVITTGDVVPAPGNPAWTSFTQIIRYQ